MSNFEIQSQISLKKQKTKQEYSRNVKKLKYKLMKVSDEIQRLQQRIQTFQNTSNDHIISMKISKFCKQRRFTPQMLFRFADTKCKNVVNRTDFKNTLISIGLKLTQHELTRLQYLLDEDISGEISWQEYNKYLYAFGMKKQYNPDDPFIKNALQKLDINKILSIGKDGKQDNKKGKHKNLLNYQQFLKYCHKNFPQLSNKQLASIFNKLKHNELIDLDELIQYLRNLEQEKQRIKGKNEKKSKKKKGEQVDQKEKQWKVQEEQQVIDIASLKGKIMAVLKYHPKQQRTFHSSQFKRVQQSYNVGKGQLVNLFKTLDKKLQGSIGYNQIICYYAQIQAYKKDQIMIKYSFQLMGQKMISEGQKPQSLVQTYVKQNQYISQEQFKKLCSLQFQLKQQISNYLYAIMLKHKLPTKQSFVETKVFVELMKISDGKSKTIVKPSLWGVFNNHLFRKDSITISTDGMIAFRLCLSISQQLHVMRQKKWDDFQFGPTFEDQHGLDSIKIDALNAKNIKWIRTEQLGMKDFYISSSREKQIFKISSLCQSDLFYKSLQMLMMQNQNFLNRNEREIIKNGKSVQQSQLNKLFEGLHPLVFHDFQQWGIYVIKFYIKSKWVYVITDDKIPCNQTGEPLFSYASNKNCSYISLIQKAYAKLKGSYSKIFDFPNISKYINQFSSLLSYDFSIENKEMDQQNDAQWEEMKYLNNREKRINEFKLHQQKKHETSYEKQYLGNIVFSNKKAKNDDKSNLLKNTPYQIFFSFEIKDQNQKLWHKSQRLSIINCPYKFQNQQKWNSQWNQSSKKYGVFKQKIQSQIRQWNQINEIPKIDLKTQNILILNHQLVQQIFNSLFVTKIVTFQGQMQILRKVLEFQKDFACLYKINCTQKDHTKFNKLVILLNKIRAPDDAIISIKMKDSEKTIKQGKRKKVNVQEIFNNEFTIKGDFGSVGLWIPTYEQDIQIKVQNFKLDQQYVYQLTFYLDSPRYSLKERDRHLLFRYVSAYQQSPKLDFGILQIKQKLYFYNRYFSNAGRKSVLCC